jgi:Co/Zn/Cd efflux system component
MFLVEFGAGWLAHSTALLADSLDMLGDALVYAFSPSVLGRGARWQARAALLKGTIMAAFGLGMVAEVIVKALRGVVPAAA